VARKSASGNRTKTFVNECDFLHPLHLRIMKMSTITICVALVGCTAPAIDPSGPSGPSGSGDPVTGIYDLTISPATGSCQPPPVTFSQPTLETLVNVLSPKMLRVQVPDGSSALETLTLADGVYDRTFDTCGAQHELRLSSTHQGDRVLMVTRIDSWSGIAAAMRDGLCNSIPANDCTSRVTLKYELREPCEPPCLVQERPSGESFWPPLACVCSGDGGTHD
jgi:hypothetical protein